MALPDLADVQWYWNKWVREDGFPYEDIARHAGIWIKELWPYALRWGLAPKGHGYDDFLLTNPPRIEVSRKLPPDTAGTWGGDTIRIAPYTMMLGFKDGHPIHDRLRITILHETQHALDSLRNVESKNDHDIFFSRRLAKLSKYFPPEGHK